ncbi:MAG: GNAT family N-acetyltransferase [Anaerolineae bacterium]|nr:GNAT family N-acetyltransferase [Anaerolineae bacterium]
MPSLVLPDVKYQESFLAGLHEFQREGRHLDLSADTLASNFATYVSQLQQRCIQPPPGRVPETVFWLVEGEIFIGRVSLRHELNEALRLIGGHIGYEIRPSWRQRGYGRLACRLALVEARRLGLTHVMITCDEDNHASRRIIESNGGRFEKAVSPPLHPTRVLHFWVDIMEGEHCV